MKVLKKQERKWKMTKTSIRKKERKKERKEGRNIE